MAKTLQMPKLSPTMEEGVLSVWHKKEGDEIAVDDLLAEVETDKATMEFRSFDKGVLLKILAPAGKTVKLGEDVAVIGAKGEDVSGVTSKAAVDNEPASANETKEKNDKKEDAPPSAATPEAPKNEAPKEEKPSGRADEIPKTQTTGAPAPIAKGGALSRTEREPELIEGTGGRVMASPFVRKTARDRGIDLAGAAGTGPHGRVVISDLDQMAAQGQPSTGNALAKSAGMPMRKEPEVRPLSPMRKTIARRLTESKTTVPHFYLTIDVDAGALADFREKINGELESLDKKGDPEEKPLKVSINDLLIKACASALSRVPECNAQFTSDAILVHKRIDISVAVAVPDGLVTPVVRDADMKSVVAIAREVRDLASRARAKKLKPEEMSDGTFSISNLGMFGIDEFCAVINPPEGAILAVGRLREEPIVRDGAVVAGKKLAMTLSCDHRVVDGAVGAAFLAELRALLDHPMRILTG